MHREGGFSHIEVLGSIGLFVATIMGLVFINSPWGHIYERLINFPIAIVTPLGQFSRPSIFWINDGLISIFFLLIGLEIKREILSGELSGRAKLALPVAAATIGAIVPAIIFALYNYDNPINMRGWAIPTATDTAFCLGVLTLLGRRVPKSIKVFLVSLAIIDDVIAVAIIAIFYAHDISQIGFLATLITFGLLVCLNLLNIHKKTPYVILGFVLWIAMLNSGIHTSIVGILLAATIPNQRIHDKPSMLEDIEKMLHPWVAFFIIPLFAFANAGVPLAEFNLNVLESPLALGIVLGLFFGKQIGIFGTTILMVKLKKASLPTNASWSQMYGASVLCGIGFTMSIFIGTLAFTHKGMEYNDTVKVAIFIGSILAAITGYIIMRFSKSREE